MASNAIAVQQESPVLRGIRKLWLPTVFLIPAAAVLIIFLAIPLFNAILLSFQSWNGMSPPNWIGLTNYQELLQDNGFWHALLDTGFFVVMTVIFQTTLPLLVANLLNSGIRGSTIFRTIYFMPVIISLTVTGLLWSMIYEPNFGLLNSLLKAFGLGTQLWLADKRLVMLCIIVVSIWQSLGFYLVIYFAALQSIPQDLYEAASIDGANAWHRLIYVTVPMLRPVMILVVVLNTVNGIKVFDQVWVMTAGGPNHASDTLGTFLYNAAFGTQGSANPQLGYATAVAMVILILSLVLSIAQIRLGQSGEVEY